MDQFKILIDTYLDIDINTLSNNDKKEYNCDYGDLIFEKNDNCVVLTGIYIKPEFRQQGLCRNIIYYIIDKSSTKYKYFCVQSVLSKILYNYLSRFSYKNKKFICTKNGFIYKLT